MTEPCNKTTGLLCDVPGCPDEAVVHHRGERRCYEHALEAGNAERARRGLPPVTIDDEGGQHVVQ